MNHTPTPYRAECWTSHAPRTVLVDDPAMLSGKRVVAECEREEDAAFIVTACGAHATLLEYFNASQAWTATAGHEDATVEDERKAEARYDAAIKTANEAVAGLK